jgi:hypothetical protein
MLKLMMPYTSRNLEGNSVSHKKNYWLTPVILATQEAEIRRIMI